MKLSNNLTLAEVIKSNTAIRRDIDNTPTEEHLATMKVTAEKLFEPLREHVGAPVKINSFYRGPKLNKAIGGAKRSQHMSGQAMDIDDTFGHMSNADMYHWIKENLNFDQLIWEFGTDKNPNWLHVSYVNDEDNRNRCLEAYKSNGKTKYKVI